MAESIRLVGTVSRGIRCPIIRQGDDLAAIVADSVLAAAAGEGFSLRDRDVISITESIVARAQGNYASVDDIAADVRAKLGGETVGVIFPILSRNRFAICLRGIAMAAKKIVVVVSGEDKADALQKAVAGPITPAVQGSILQLHPDVTIVCDEAAYSKLK